MKIYIYSYINKKTNNRYIGKTNNIERRKREHESDSFNKESTTYHSMWAKKVREYGMNGFDFEILEVTDEKNWKEREMYWIEYYNTFYGAGYNSTAGGDSNENLSRSLSDEQALELINLLKTDMSVSDICSLFEVSETLVSNINQGQKYIQKNIQYPIRKRYKESFEYDNLVEDLKNSTLSFKLLSEKHNISEAMIKKINYGSLRNELSETYPIRKISGVIQKANTTKELLIHSELSFKEIVELAEVSIRTVKRINDGETHFDPSLNYPLRKPVSTIPLIGK